MSQTNPNPGFKEHFREASADTPNDPHRFKRVQHTRDELIEQGSVIRRSLEAQAENLKAIAARVAERRIERVHVLGCGDSWYTGLGVRDLFESLLHVPAEGTQALDYALYTHGTSNDKTLVIGISSSGKTPAVNDALEAASARGAFTIGVSNKPETPFLKTTDASIFVPATRVGWPTQSTTAGMAVLGLFACELAAASNTAPADKIKQIRSGLDRLPGLADAVVQSTDAPVQAIMQELAEATFLFYAGAGSHYAAAYIGAGKVRELSPINTLATPLEEFHHYRTLRPHDVVFMVAPDEASHARALDTAEVTVIEGGRMIALVPEGEQEISAIAKWTLHLPPIDRELAPILYSMPLHWAAYHLAMAKFERGLGYPGAFPGAQIS